MSWYNTIFRRDKLRKRFKGNKNKMPRTIYEPEGVTFDEHTKKFHLVHHIFKYRFMVPFLKLSKKLLRKHLIKDVPKENHNRNLIIFDKAFEESIIKWNTLYRRHDGDPKTRKSKRWWRRHMDDSIDELRTMKDMVNTMYLYDTAYREFMNILLHEIAHDMCNYYKDHPNKETGHLFFTTDIYDTQYYVLEKMVETKTMYAIHPGSDEMKQ